MWGTCCFNKGDIKVTLGTGSFLNLNTGSECNASIYGLYPLVAWNHGEVIYTMEGSSNDTGSIIQWAMNFGLQFRYISIVTFFMYANYMCVSSGLFADASESATIANTVNGTDGVFFVPAFSGLGVNLN